MRVAIRHIAGHLVWSTQGSVWALYRLHPGPNAQGRVEETVQGTYVAAAVRDEQLAKITQLVRSLSGAPRLFGLCAQVDPGEVALRMIEGIEPAEQAPGAGRYPWVENVEATLDLLDDQEMHRRTLWLAVPLQTESAGMQVSASLGAARAELSPILGLRPAAVARREVAAYREQASHVQAALTGGITFRPARPAGRRRSYGSSSTPCTAASRNRCSPRPRTATCTAGGWLGSARSFRPSRNSPSPQSPWAPRLVGRPRSRPMKRTPGTVDARARHASTLTEVSKSLDYVPTQKPVQYQLDL